MGDTYSANSLKLLDKDPEAFKLKYGEGIFLNPDNSSAKAGQNLHSFLCFYLKGFDMGKIEASFSKKDREFIENIKEFDAVKTLKNAGKKDIEQPFLIRCTKEGEQEFYLTGRFDAVLRLDNKSGGNNCSVNDGNVGNLYGVEIYDWKTVNIPKNPEDDIQTVVYLYAASKLYKTQNVSVTYVSLSKNESKTVCFDQSYNYLSKIEDIVQKAEQ